MVEFDAAILPAVGRPLEIRRTRIGQLERGDVLVQIMATGLCHTDLEVIDGSLAYPMPIALGHEGAGIVEAVGEDVTDVTSGDHVVCSWNPHCGHCFYCERDQPILCEPFTFHQPRGHLLDGKSRLTCTRRPCITSRSCRRMHSTPSCRSQARFGCPRKFRSIEPA